MLIDQIGIIVHSKNKIDEGKSILAYQFKHFFVSLVQRMHKWLNRFHVKSFIFSSSKIYF